MSSRQPASTETFVPTTLTIHVTIWIDPENIEPFLTALRPVWQRCIAEPKCSFFDVWHDPETPGRFRFVEVWDADRKWFEEVQINKPYYEPYTAITMPMWLKDREIQFMERVKGWSYAGEEYLADSIGA